MRKLLALLLALFIADPLSASVLLNQSGDNDYLFTNSPPSLNPPYSVSCWAKLDDTSRMQDIWSYTDQDLNFYEMRTDNSNTRFETLTADTGAGPDGAVSDSTYSSGTWYSVVSVWSTSTDQVVYKNGTRGFDGTAGRSPTGLNQITIGILNSSSNGGNIFYFKGRIAECGVWNIALSDANATSLAGGANPLTIQSANLIAYWRLYNNANDGKGTYTLSTGGSPTFDTADHPAVTPPAGGATVRHRPIIIQ